MNGELLGTEHHCASHPKCNTTSGHPTAPALVVFIIRNLYFSPREASLCAAVSGSAQSQLPNNGRSVICIILNFFSPLLKLLGCLKQNLKAEPCRDGAWGVGTARYLKLKLVHICLCFFPSVLGFTWPHRGIWPKRHSGKQPFICLFSACFYKRLLKKL